MIDALRSPEHRSRRARLRRPHPATLLGAALLFLVWGYSLATLTRFPLVYGDESWIGSAAWSFVEGHGFRPSIAVGGGVYDHGALDYWLPRLGTLPFIVADALAGPSFWAFRFAALLVGALAIAVFVWGLRKRYGLPVALMASVVLSATWGFLGTSHYVRWDSLAFLLACTLLAVFIRSRPSRRTALLIGFLLGLTPDIETAILGATPAVVLLIAWERADRFARLGRLAIGGAGGAFAYLALHDFPFGRGSTQYDAVYGPAYQVPLRDVLKQHSLDPIWNERLRYHFMNIAYPADRLMLDTLVLGLAAFVAVVVVRRPRRAYPVHLVPGLLLASHLGGIALIEPNKAPVFAYYALPYAICAITELVVLASGRLPAPAQIWIPVLVLAAVAFIQFRDTRSVELRTPKEPIFSAAFSRLAGEVVRPGDSVLGDYIYWWGFKDVNYHWNSWIWNYRWAHHAPLERAFNRLCPDVVLYDDVWNSRYLQTESFGPRFPSMAPTDPSEKVHLRALLRREYRLVGSDVIDGRHIEFWRRRPGGCSGILTNGGGTA